MVETQETIIETFGDYLKRHREASGKTVDVISKTTRIPRRYLDAFEENAFNKFPEEAFTRGFLRCYATEIGLDIDETLGRYESYRRATMPTQIKDVREFKRISTDSLDHYRKPFPWGQVIIVTVVVAFLAGFGYWGSMVFLPYLKEAAINARNDAPPSTPLAQTTADNPTTSSPGARAETPATAAQETAPQAPVVVPATPSILLVTALQNGSLVMRVDDHSAQEVTLKSGETHTTHVYREVEIRMSDKRAFRFQYEGKPLEVSGPVIKLFNRNLFEKQN